MDPRRECILVLLSICMVMKFIIMSILIMQKVAIFEHNIQMFMMAVFIMGKYQANFQRMYWKWEH